LSFFAREVEARGGAASDTGATAGDGNEEADDDDDGRDDGGGCSAVSLCVPNEKLRSDAIHEFLRNLWWTNTHTNKH
jgi:hypothetical protein